VTARNRHCGCNEAIQNLTPADIGPPRLATTDAIAVS
jgi:hypothetical protein